MAPHVDGTPDSDEISMDSGPEGDTCELEGSEHVGECDSIPATSVVETLEDLEGLSGLVAGTLANRELEILEFLGSSSTLDALIDGPNSSRIPVDFLKLVTFRPDLVNAIAAEEPITGLMVAACYGYTEAVEFLVTNGADVFILNYRGYNCLHIAAVEGRLEAARLILNSDQAASGMETAPDEEEESSLEEADSGKESTTSRSLVNTSTKYGGQETALMLAAENGHTEVVRLLLEHGADVFRTNCSGWTCLHFAARYNDHTAVLEEILKCGGADIVNVRDLHGKTALIQASAYGKDNEAVVKCLLDHRTDATIKDTYMGWNCLHHTAYRGTSEILNTILVACPDIVNSKTEKMFTPLTLSTFTALMIACYGGCLEDVLVLLEHKADVLLTEDHDGFNCLHYAVAMNNWTIVQAILRHSPQVVNTTTVAGLNALMIASEHHDDVSMVRLLLDHQADPFMTSKDGWNSLHHAAYNGRLAIFKEILQSDPDIANSTTPSGSTALMLASENGHKNIVKLLSEHAHNFKNLVHVVNTVSYVAEFQP
ncbi:hypothetical protein Mapa_006289 [Marchantia paleacea]|nr:hypothetical protein Mapa_006289 [Marchantia paleacea]